MVGSIGVGGTTVGGSINIGGSTIGSSIIGGNGSITEGWSIIGSVGTGG
jgi:hypothetical protein